MIPKADFVLTRAMTTGLKKVARQIMVHAGDPIGTADADQQLFCPKCGRKVESLCCGHCGSQLPAWQADLYGAVVKRIAKTGGNRADDGHQGGDPASKYDNGNGDEAIAVSSFTGEIEDLQNTATPPSLCLWISQRLQSANIHPNTILDPCAGAGNLTRPFRPRSQVVEYEISRGLDFFGAKKVACDLVICNPPWKDALHWLQKIVEVVGNRTPIVFISPMLFFIGYKSAPCRQYLDSPEAPRLDHITPLPADTFVRVYCPGAILWLNLPEVRNVALVPARSLIRSNNIGAEEVLQTDAIHDDGIEYT
jgi:hypothetical protein